MDMHPVTELFLLLTTLASFFMFFFMAIEEKNIFYSAAAITFVFAVNLICSAYVLSP